MPVTALLGLQWGDEGKGKIVDALSGSLDVIVRAQGGANAGHTVTVGGRKRVLHLIPSGMLHPHVVGVIGNGTVVDPLQIVKEIDGLLEEDCDVQGRLWLSERAHLVLPYHKVVDASEEILRGASAIGTTGRGIGPAYQDKAARTGIRAGELRNEGRFLERVRAGLEAKRALLPAELSSKLDEAMVIEELMTARQRLAPMVRDTVAYVHAALDADKALLLEGAQGTMLDLDIGTYPYVTSSNCQMGGMLAGSGLPPRCVDKVIGVAKAYCTRVGEGPFPSEIDGPAGDEIRERGNEFGATTGRPRRCGWFDAVAMRYAVRVNGVSELVITKMDVLSGQPEIEVATSYTGDTGTIEDFPSGDVLDHITPAYRKLPGFEGDLSAARTWNDLPEHSLQLIACIEELLTVKVTMVSTGPNRDELVSR